MDDLRHILKLRSQVAEIRNYYLLDSNATRGPFTMSRSAARFLLPELDNEEVAILFEKLRRCQLVVSLDQDWVTFSPLYFRHDLVFTLGQA